MRLYTLLLFLFNTCSVINSQSINFDSLSEVISNYPFYSKGADRNSNIEEACKFIYSEYRSGNQDAAYRTTTELIALIDPLKSEYRYAELVKTRSKMAIGLDDRSQLEADLLVMSELANSSTNDSVKALANFSIAENLKSERDFSNAIIYYDRSIGFYEQVGKYRNAIMAMVFMASCHDYEYRSDKAILILKDAISKTEHFFKDDVANRDNLLYRAYISMGNIIQKTRDYERSNEYYLKTLELNAKDDNYRATSLTNISSSYVYQQDLARAKEYAQRAIALKGTTKSKRKAVLNIATKVYNLIGQLDSSLIYLNEFRSLSGSPGKSKYSSYLLRKGDYEFLTGSYDNSHETFKTVLHFLRDKEASKLSSIRYALEGINKANVYRYGKDSAITYFEQLIDQIDTLNTKNNENEILRATVLYQTELKEAENQRLRDSNNAKRLGIFGLVAMLLTSFAATYYWFKNLRITRRYNDLLRDEKEELQRLNESMKIRIEDLAMLADPEAKVMITRGAKQFPVNINDIVYIFMKNDVAHYQLESGEIRRSTFLFKEAEAGLPVQRFFRPKRGYLINLAKIKFINRNHIMMIGDYEVPLTNARRKELMGEIEED